MDALVDLDLGVNRARSSASWFNRAGKATIRLLLGYLHATSGTASVLGLDAGRDDLAIRRRVGYLPGGIALYDTMSGEDILDYLCRLYRRPAVRRQAIADRLEMSAATLRRPVRDYSRGMRQKIGVIQALQHDPELAILDEPTEGLDPLMQRAFYDLLDELKREGRTIFLSSHVLSEVERVATAWHHPAGPAGRPQDVGVLLSSASATSNADRPAPVLDGVQASAPSTCGRLPELPAAG